MDTALSGVRHHTFTVARELDAPVETVFRAFSDDSLRRRWFKMPGSDGHYEFDFRAGGTERASSNFTMLDGTQERVENRSRWIEIVPDRRIVQVYEAFVSGVRVWTALVTIELYVLPDQDRTLLDWTEQVALLQYRQDGELDIRHLRGATGLRLNGLALAVTQA
jgi:uncharacterized protein YndB with AHSA1/START domain